MTPLTKYPEIAHLPLRERRRVYTRKAREARQSKSLCTRCGAAGPSVRKNEMICVECWFKHIARLRTGSMKNGTAIKDLLQQQGFLCVYTGEPLIPGVNASLDHKTPISRGGTNSIDNLQWVTTRINSFKNYLTHVEFVTLCSLISERFGESLASKQNCMLTL
jgi:5-methylcytosine-specific restriction endonuclease McrA